jgi:hypothetical protein
VSSDHNRLWIYAGCAFARKTVLAITLVFVNVVCWRMLMCAGDGHTIVVLSNGSALAYGLCDSGQLGIGNLLGACKVCAITL